MQIKLHSILFLGAALAGCGGPGGGADRIFINGKIWTGNEEAPWAEALAVQGETLLEVGTEDQVLALKGSSTEVIDLQNGFTVPGFNDAHSHFLALERVELETASDVAEIQGRLSNYSSTHPSKEWVIGRGWVYTMFPDNSPHKSCLDEVLPDKPVLLRDRDGHAALANSRALEIAGLTEKSDDPVNGIIVRDELGQPTGLLKESAIGLVSRHIPPPSDQELYETLLRRLDQAASCGLTSIQNASSIALPTWERVLSEGLLKVRVYAAVPFEKDLSKEDLLRYRDLREKHRGPWIKMGSVKGMLDGTVDSRTAAMFEPYIGGGNGTPMWSQEDLDKAVAFYDREGFQIMLHAIGDRAVHMALDAYEGAARRNGTRGMRHRVEHIEVPGLEDLPRFRQLGVIASTQAIFASPDEATLGNYAPLLGPERSRRSNAFRLFDDAGALQAFGSDWPVFTMDPLQGMYAAVARMTPEGSPAGGWYPENCISPEAALRHYTRDSAYASFDEDKKGTLEEGKLADFVVLSENILESPAETILRARVRLTVVGGKDTFRSDSF